MDKEDLVHRHGHTHTHTQTGILALKKNEIMPFTAATWMDVETIKLGEVNLTEKDKHHIL